MPTQVFYATNRGPVGDATAAPHYALDAVAGEEAVLHTGMAEVTTAADPEAPRRIETVLPDVPPARRAKPGVAPAVAAWAESAVQAQQDAVLFVHGFANDWSDSIRRAAQMRDFYAIPRDRTALPFSLLGFGWPSDGVVMPVSTHYPADRKDAAAAGAAFAALLAQVAEVAPGLRAKRRRLHLIAHSMGNWALRHGLAAFRRRADAAPLFDEVLLTAADEDHDALTDKAKLGGLFALARRVTVHVYDFDVILMISQKLNGGDRLGEEWPVPLPAPGGRDDAVLRVGPVITEQQDPNLSGHQYYRNNPDVRRDVIAVFEGKEQATIRGRKPDGQASRHFVLWGATAGSPPVA